MTGKLERKQVCDMKRASITLSDLLSLDNVKQAHVQVAHGGEGLKGDAQQVELSASSNKQNQEC